MIIFEKEDWIRYNIYGSDSEKVLDSLIEFSIRKDMDTMCNLSQGIEDNGIAIGRAEGQAKIRQIILNMYEKGFTAEQITAVTEEKLEDVKSIIAGK